MIQLALMELETVTKPNATADETTRQTDLERIQSETIERMHRELEEERLKG
jgi:hypothetical protein